MGRFIAFIILVIPGIMAAGGIKLVRDTFFGKLIEPFPFLTVQLIVGVVLIISGLWFFAGFLLRRDRKRGNVQERFKK